MLTITEQQKERVKKEWESIAKESLVIETGETVQDPIIAFGSEIAVLRLFHKFAGGSARVSFSKNLNTWFFSNK